MAPEVIEGLVVLGSAVLGMACYRAWTAQTAHLNLSLFRPYRGDPWPIGVQEDDDFHFNWEAAASPSGTEVDEATGTVIGAVELEWAGVTQLVSLEEVPRGLVAVERVDTIAVRRGGS